MTRMITFGTSHSDVAFHGTYGEIPKSLIGPDAVSAANLLAREIWDAAAASPPDTPPSEDLLKKIDQMRTLVGAYDWWLSDQLNEARHRAYQIGDSYWIKCFFYAFFRRDLTPYKFRDAIVGHGSKYTTAITQLKNMPHRDIVAKRWLTGPMTTWWFVMEAVNKRREQLQEIELDYRNAMMAVAQIGLGIGGMYLGLIGLVLGIAIPLIF